MPEPVSAFTPAVIAANKKVCEAATAGPWEVWKDHAAVFAGPAKENTESTVSGYRGAICDLDTGCIDTEELEEVGPSEWTPEEAIVMNRFNDCAFFVAAADPDTGYRAALLELRRAQASDLGLRKKIHMLERHNQLFPRCESPWCHPNGTLVVGSNPDPALEFALDTAIMDQSIATDWESANRETARLRAELAKRDEPVKVISEKFRYACSECRVGVSQGNHFCSCCGRKLDWGNL